MQPECSSPFSQHSNTIVHHIPTQVKTVHISDFVCSVPSFQSLPFKVTHQLVFCFLHTPDNLQHPFSLFVRATWPVYAIVIFLIPLTLDKYHKSWRLLRKGFSPCYFFSTSKLPPPPAPCSQTPSTYSLSFRQRNTVTPTKLQLCTSPHNIHCPVREMF